MIRIAPEGRRVIGVCGAFAALLALGAAWLGAPAVAAPGVVLLGFACWFFRDPDRDVPANPREVVAPADGRVLDIVDVPENAFLGGPARRVSIFMSPLNVHVNRVPMGGVIERIEHTPGKFHAAFADKASDENERTALVVNGDGGRYLVVQIAGAVARRIVCRRREGDVLARGERYGMIMFGSRVDLYLPTETRITATPGMRVRAGSSVIAEVPA